MSRFFFHPEPQPGKVLALPPEETHHLTVQRIPLHSDVLVGDGKGRLYRGVFQGKNRESALVFIAEKVYEEPPPHPLCVWQSLLRSPARMEWLVEKLTEIGVTEIGFFPTERSVKGNISETKVQRFVRIAISACKQSGRTWFPKVRAWASWREFLSHLSAQGEGRMLLADPSGTRNLVAFLQEEGTQCLTGLIIGPEGDFTEAEKRELQRQGVYPVTLGKRILRSETAALFGAVILSAFLEVYHAGERENSWV